MDEQVKQKKADIKSAKVEYKYTKVHIEDFISIDGGPPQNIPHVHDKHTLTMGIHGEDVRTGNVLHVNLHFCPKCKLVWFEELEPTSRLMMPGVPQR